MVVKAFNDFYLKTQGLVSKDYFMIISDYFIFFIQFGSVVNCGAKHPVVLTYFVLEKHPIDSIPYKGKGQRLECKEIGVGNFGAQNWKGGAKHSLRFPRGEAHYDCIQFSDLLL